MKDPRPRLNPDTGEKILGVLACINYVLLFLIFMAGAIFASVYAIYLLPLFIYMYITGLHVVLAIISGILILPIILIFSNGLQIIRG